MHLFKTFRTKLLYHLLVEQNGEQPLVQKKSPSAIYRSLTAFSTLPKKPLQSFQMFSYYQTIDVCDLFGAIFSILRRDIGSLWNCLLKPPATESIVWKVCAATCASVTKLLISKNLTFTLTSIQKLLGKISQKSTNF